MLCCPNDSSAAAPIRSRGTNMMKLFSRHVAVRLALCLLLTAIVCSSLTAQELMKDTAKPTTPATEPTVSERVRLLESELERQNTKLDQLQKTIADQQLAIKALLDKLSTENPAASAVTATALSAPVSAPSSTGPATTQ